MDKDLSNEQIQDFLNQTKMARGELARRANVKQPSLVNMLAGRMDGNNISSHYGSSMRNRLSDYILHQHENWGK